MDECPWVVNVASLSKKGVAENSWITRSFTFIDNKLYWQNLAEDVGEKDVKHAMVVIGPKDTAMIKISTTLRQQLLFNISSYSDIYDCTRKQCFRKKALGIIEVGSITTFAASNKVFFTIVSLFVGLHFLWDYVHNHHFLKYLGYLGVAVGILLLMCMLLMVLWYNFPYIYGYIHTLNHVHSLEHGDLSTVICYMNCGSKMKPGQGPIVIIREIINFEPKVLQETMEHYKEDGVSFGADFLWIKARGFINQLSYWPYVIEVVCFEEGKH